MTSRLHSFALSVMSSQIPMGKHLIYRFQSPSFRAGRCFRPFVVNQQQQIASGLEGDGDGLMKCEILL